MNLDSQTLKFASRVNTRSRTKSTTSKLSTAFQSQIELPLAISTQQGSSVLAPTLVSSSQSLNPSQSQRVQDQKEHQEDKPSTKTMEKDNVLDNSSKNPKLLASRPPRWTDDEVRYFISFFCPRLLVAQYTIY